ncbi:CAP domain-containing protein [Aureispira anguillae]|uniref:CAP domain-containing protein n=1 Tax=Aureispira anguillae TaxID=2864201 RepID=A0A915YC03_9BACT|nr:CAP domain-containing protein [Aureispira anguillae]BDS10297.1 CAP domain-containing protein [Aureispira anguillae]
MSEISNFEVEILQLINSHRASLNLAILEFHPLIQKASYEHSNNMATSSIPFGHDGFSVRANQLVQMLKGSAASENVALGQRTANEVVQSWLDSNGHRKNIEGDFNLTGISVVKNTRGENVFTQIFIKAPAPSSEHHSTPAPTDHLDSLEKSADVNLNYQLLKLINKHRAGQYLPALQLNPHIQALATQHAQDMATQKLPFGHDNFEERARSLITQLSGSSAAENVALGQDDPLAIVNSWLDSNAHRNNIEGDFNLTGIGIGQSEDQEMYYCQIFIKK